MDDYKQIELLVNNYIKAISSQDKDDFMNLWTGKNNTLISVINKYDSLENIYQDFLIGSIQKNYAKIDLIAQDLEIKFITNELALVIFEYRTECIKRDSNEEYGIHGLETQVIQKINGHWKIVHLHYSKE